MASTKITDLKAKLFRGLADPSRLAILTVLRSGASTVNQIVEQTGLSQSNVSNHLACLRCCNLVVREQQGRHVYYELADVRVAKLLDLADALLAEVASGVSECANYSLLPNSKSGVEPTEEPIRSTAGWTLSDQLPL